jgi:hypothetical protein
VKILRKAIGTLMVLTILSLIGIGAIFIFGIKVFLICLGASVLVCVFFFGALMLIFD